MFVSSYKTYTAHKHSPKIDRNSQSENRRERSFQRESFSTKLEKAVSSSNKLPLNYISNYKTLHNQQLLQQNEPKKEYAKTKFEKINKMSTAQNAYNENSKLFSLLQKPKIALIQMVQQPKNIEPNTLLKQKFINTYIANDNYYKITAA